MVDLILDARHSLWRSQEYHGLSATMQFAKRYGGVAVLWEHRYYGASLPFPVNVRLCVLENQ